MTPKGRIWGAVALLSLLAAGCGSGQPSAQPKPHNNVKTTKKAPMVASQNKSPQRTLKVIAFYDQTMAQVPPDPFYLLKAHPGLVDYVAPFWYEAAADGSIIAKPEGNAAAAAAADHLPLMPLVNNAGGTDAFLHSASTRTTLVNNLVQLINNHHYAGLNIDFQQLQPADRQALTAFMTQLYHALPPHVALSMSVVPLTNLNGASSAYDYQALSPMVSAMVLMAYDRHGDGTPPGPVSPYPWVVQSVNRALNAGIPRQKLYLGIANYGYLWTDHSTHAQTIPLKVMYQHKYGKFVWNPTYKEAYDSYTVNGVPHVIWFVNDRGAVDRIKLAEKDHLGGVAFWRIGYEDAKWWNAVAAALNHQSVAAAMRAKVSPQHPLHHQPKKAHHH